MDSRDLQNHLRFFEELGVTGVSRDPAWRRRGPAPGTPALDASAPPDAPAAAPVPVPAPAPLHVITRAANGGAIPVAEASGDGLAVIRSDIGECTRCKLHNLGRTQIVFGVGNPSAELMFVGEAPGADEDLKGEPFVGRAGQLLTRMIAAMGFARGEVYIANVLKCRPPNNRNPEPDEIERCEPFLLRQIETVRPKVIVALGAFAARTLLRTADPISRLRGRVFEFHGAKLIPTFHPSFLLRSPGYKRDAWDDLKKALAILGRQPPPPHTAPPDAS